MALEARSSLPPEPRGDGRVGAGPRAGRRRAVRAVGVADRAGSPDPPDAARAALAGASVRHRRVRTLAAGARDPRRAHLAAHRAGARRGGRDDRDDDRAAGRLLPWTRRYLADAGD